MPEPSSVPAILENYSHVSLASMTDNCLPSLMKQTIVTYVRQILGSSGAFLSANTTIFPEIPYVLVCFFGGIDTSTSRAYSILRTAFSVYSQQLHVVRDVNIADIIDSVQITHAYAHFIYCYDLTFHNMFFWTLSSKVCEISTFKVRSRLYWAEVNFKSEGYGSEYGLTSFAVFPCSDIYLPAAITKHVSMFFRWRLLSDKGSLCDCWCLLLYRVYTCLPHPYIYIYIHMYVLCRTRMMRIAMFTNNHPHMPPCPHILFCTNTGFALRVYLKAPCRDGAGNSGIQWCHIWIRLQASVTLS